MSKELFVSSTPHETKVAIVEDDQLSEIYYERENEYTLAGSIYKGRVTRVLPGMQSAFVNIGLERDAFLYVSDFLLEEEEDTEGLEQVVSRSRPVIIEPADQDEHANAPLEAEDIIPPAEAAGEEEGEAGEAEEAGPEQAAGEDQDREGARKWRGRRRRRGRGGRFQEREDREDREGREARERPAEAAPDAHAASRPEPRHEPRFERRPEPPSDLEPIILPGESLSKYRPHGESAAPAEAKAPAPPRPTARPSTEYSLNPSDFAPGSMVLPGESIAKYQHEPERGRATVAEAHEPELHTHGFEQDLASAGPVPHHYDEEPSHGESREELRSATFTRKPAVEEVEQEEQPSGVTHEPEVHEQAKPEEEQRFEQMNVAAVFGGEAVQEPEQESAQEFEDTTSHEHDATPEAGEQPAHDVEAHSGGPWQASGKGVVEEEEIEEEESELPGFEEHFELSDFDELEEEELGPSHDHLVAAGRELTEAVRDAHINERATGQYEAEGLEEGAEEGSDEGREDEFLERFSHVTDEQEQGEEFDEAEVEELAESEEDVEGARAEHRAGTGTAGYQQPRPERRGPGRRGDRRPGRRMRGRRGHHVPQRQLPAISDLLKEGQEIVVQIAKEPIAKKGARITSHIALPGRFLVYMPTVHHTGVSRKIASEEERHRLKRIVLSERGDANGGFIVRTAAAGANEDDLRADIRFLINLWNEIKGRADKSKAPALIYHDLNLVERILRDQVTSGFSAIWADTEQEYERILRFVSRFQPSLIRRVKLYSKDTPLFEQFNITEEINKALKSKVWLKSGGYIVINQTEALVAIDINTGKYVGKTARLEDTIVKTNIDAIKEIVRQIRLRDLGGIIVIDFIDMDERKNRQRVMQALEEALKADRAPSKVLQFNDFGLVAITRKRVKQSLERTLGQPCPTCQATGMIKSVTTVCNEIYVEMRKMARHFERDVMLRVNPEVAKALKANAGKWLQEMEELTKRTILVKSDPLLHPEHFDIQ
ncbi:MAG TPA: Rne/Rng family ribonuclease [Candidatus Angelobacter sp.]|nr:Rne/Rng family ribonuclease [Candidatus Angelobacter sp.]